MAIDIIPKDDTLESDFETNQPNEYIANTKAVSRQWLIDIGANNYIYTNKAFFTDYHAYRPSDVLYLWFIAAPRGSAKAEGYRTIKIGILVLDRKINEISFQSVYALGNCFSIYSACKGR